MPKTIFLWACLLCSVHGRITLKTRKQNQLNSRSGDPSSHVAGPRSSLTAVAALLSTVQRTPAWQVVGARRGCRVGSRRISSNKGISFYPRLSAKSRCPSVQAQDIAPDKINVVEFLKAAKKGIITQLEEDGGTLDLDGLATLQSIMNQNPCYPNPADDNDLWCGKWRLLSSTIACDGMRQCACSLDVKFNESAGVWDDRDLTLEATLSIGPSEVKAVLQLAGKIGKINKVELELPIESLTLTVEDSEKMEEISPLVKTIISEEFGMQFEQEATRWTGVEPFRRPQLEIEYLDQDFLVMRVLTEKFIILSKVLE